MSWTRETTIWCDDSNCGKWETAGGNVGYVEKLLFKIGWTKKGAYHFCPKCSSRKKKNCVTL